MASWSTDVPGIPRTSRIFGMVRDVLGDIFAGQPRLMSVLRLVDGDTLSELTTTSNGTTTTLAKRRGAVQHRP
jgi:hypothetical protein